MRIPGRKTLRTAWWWARSRFRARALILGYHRLGGGGLDPFASQVSMATFRSHLATLRRRARPLGLSALVQGLRDGTLEDGSVAVTFDDAYAATLAALPELSEEFGIPFTVFVPTDLMGHEPWWDRLQRILAAPAVLPGELVLDGGGWTLRRATDPEERSELAARGRLVMDVYRHLRRSSPTLVGEILDRVELWTGAVALGSPHTVAAPELVSRFGAVRGLDFGSHSASHPFLADLPEEAQRRELISSRSRLQDLLGRPVDLFAYPNGSFSSATPGLVADAGYTGGCCSRPDVVTSWSDPVRLPRLWPGDAPDQVSRMLDFWFGG